MFNILATKIVCFPIVLLVLYQQCFFFYLDPFKSVWIVIVTGLMNFAKKKIWFCLLNWVSVFFFIIRIILYDRACVYTFLWISILNKLFIRVCVGIEKWWTMNANSWYKYFFCLFVYLLLWCRFVQMNIWRKNRTRNI